MAYVFIKPHSLLFYVILSSDIHRLNSTLLPIALERRFTVYKVKTASVVIDTSGTKSNENNDEEDTGDTNHTY